MNKDYYFMLRNTPNTESLIIEYGFIDNIKDAQKLKKNYKDYVDAVVDAVIEYKNIPINNDYYTVKKGDTLWSVAKKYNISVNELKSLNNLDSNMLSIGQKLKIKENNNEIIIDIDDIPNTYEVKKGDTLYSIANKYNTTVDKLKDINNLIDNTLSVGQILLINDEKTIDNFDNSYIVKKGDTLYSIANKYNTTVDKLKDINNLNDNTLSIGQILYINNDNNIFDNYIVKKGDTLYSIANKYKISIDDLKRINNLNTNILSIGQTLKIPINN